MQHRCMKAPSTELAATGRAHRADLRNNATLMPPGKTDWYSLPSNAERLQYPSNTKRSCLFSASSAFKQTTSFLLSTCGFSSVSSLLMSSVPKRCEEHDAARSWASGWSFGPPRLVVRFFQAAIREPEPSSTASGRLLSDQLDGAGA